jgi:MFS family permease
VLFWSQVCTLISTIGATYAKSYAGFTACRTLQGFFGAPPQVLGLQVIYSLFFFHQRAKAINVWAFSFLIGPYLGPFISGFVVERLDWRNTFGVLCGFYGFSVLMIIFLGEETTYSRDGVQGERIGGIKGRIAAITGIQGVRERHERPPVLEVSKDLFGLLGRPYLLVPSKLPLVSYLTARPLTLLSIWIRHIYNNVDYRHSFYHNTIREASSISLL